jgi:hypothetical protein
MEPSGPLQACNGTALPLLLPPPCAIVMKSGNLNFLEPSGPLQACNGTALLNTKCGFWFSLQRLSETFLILRRIHPDITLKVQSCSHKVPLLLSDCNETWNFVDRFLKNPQISNSTKIRPVEAELFRADGRTDMTQLIVASRNFSNATKIQFTSDRKLTASSLQILVCSGVYCTSHKKHIKYTVWSKRGVT